MRPFDELTARGQVARLRRMALTALEQYDVEPRRVRLVANNLNGIFRVDTADGRSYALRISHPTWRTGNDLQSEVLWLDALHRETDIGAPVPSCARDGALFVTVEVESIPEPRRCVLLSWLPGVLLAERLSKENVHKLGVLSARLHEHGAGFEPPSGFTTRMMDGLYVRGEEDVLFTDEYRDVFTDEGRAIFERVMERVRAAFARLYADPSGRRPIHNDLHHENVKVFRGKLQPLDFEDALWGYPVQDIAMTWYDLLDHADPESTDYDALREAFERGYTSRAAWPEAYPDEIDAFIAGRQIWRANYVARHERRYARDHNMWIAARFRAFLANGRFER
ncbi:MAG: phosphotransferase [Chloroflexota bacterium]|nr:phosphotransferase [Chloroflexota bacterium]